MTMRLLDQSNIISQHGLIECIWRLFQRWLIVRWFFLSKPTHPKTIPRSYITWLIIHFCFILFCSITTTTLPLVSTPPRIVPCRHRPAQWTLVITQIVLRGAAAATSVDPPVQCHPVLRSGDEAGHGRRSWPSSTRASTRIWVRQSESTSYCGTRIMRRPGSPASPKQRM